MRRSLRFIPSGGETLENRLALSPVASPHAIPARGEIQIAVPADSELHHPAHPTPTRTVNREFTRFPHHVATAATQPRGIPGENATPLVPRRARLTAGSLATAFATKPAQQAPGTHAQPGGARATGRRLAPRPIPLDLAPNRLAQAVPVIPRPTSETGPAPNPASASVQSPPIPGTNLPFPRS